MGGQPRAPRNAGDEINLVEERHGAAAILDARLVKTLQHAIGKCRGPRAAAGERHRDHGVVERRPGVDAELGGLLLRGADELGVDRMVMGASGAAEYLSAADHEGGKPNTTPRANPTLELTPTH